MSEGKVKKEKRVKEPKLVKEKKVKKKDDKVQSVDEIKELLGIDDEQLTQLELETRQRVQDMQSISSIPRRLIRSSVRAGYNIQDCRIKVGNQIAAIFKTKLGQEPGKSEEELKEESQKLLGWLRNEYRRITDAVAEAINAKKDKVLKRKSTPKSVSIEKMEEHFEKEGYITDATEFILVETYDALCVREDQIFNDLAELVHKERLWIDYCSKVPGIGETITAILISEIDIHKVKYPSQILSLAGICPGPDGKGISKRDEHLVYRPYISKNDKLQIKKSIKFNPFLKTKLMGVAAGSLMKHNQTGYNIWCNYRHRLENRPDCKDFNGMHIKLMADRYLLKLWIIDLYKYWRTLEGLPIEPSYEEKKLGIVHTAPNPISFFVKKPPKTEEEKKRIKEEKEKKKNNVSNSDDLEIKKVINE